MGWHVIGIQPIVSDRRGPASLLFIHGLDGDPLLSWGEADCPGAFIRRLAAVRSANAFTVDYPACLKSFAANSRYTVRDIADELSEPLSELLSRVGKIEIVAHCLGGLIITQSLRRAFERSTAIRSRLAGANLRMAFLDCPQLAPNPSSPWLGRLIDVLGVAPDELRRNVAWLVSERPPSVAMVPVEPSWVAACSPFSAVDYRFTLPLSHERLAKAPRRGSFAPLEILAALGSTAPRPA